MNYKQFGIAFVILAILLVSKLSATERASPQTSFTGCASLSPLIAFIAIETSYPPIEDCPQITVTNNDVLRMFISRKSIEHSDVPVALYLPARSKILVSMDIDLTTLLGQSFLLHELVHAHQFQHGVAANAPCIGWLEREAYQIQAKFLRQNGADLEALSFDSLGFLQSACAQAYHPEFNAQ